MKEYLKEGGFYSFTLADSREYIAKAVTVGDDVVLFDKPASVFFNEEGKVEMGMSTLTGDITNLTCVLISNIQTLLPAHPNAVEAYTQIVDKEL